jgi:hypothetical protein
MLNRSNQNTGPGLAAMPPRASWRRIGPVTAGVLFSVMFNTTATADPLQDFAQQCDAAIGISVSDFVCDAGTLVPDTHPVQNSCDRPDQLNQDCDPGSHFQVLANTPNAFVVGHCRKRGNAAGRFGDIAVIQHNRISGATCFYQALQSNLDGNVKAPSKGGGTYPWLSPASTAAIGCAGCHDNGAVIRSPYLSQIQGIDQLPGAGDSSFNRNQPYSFVGADFTNWKTYRVQVEGNQCIGCHRLGVNNVRSGQGTARDFAIRATAPSQQNKNPHSASSPMWMLPGEQLFSPDHAAWAAQVKACGDQFIANGALPNSAACQISQFSGNATQRTCNYGADQCQQGFVWREAFKGDHVCVPGNVRAQAWADNAAAAQRRSPNGGPYGPDTCKQGFVWREAAKRPADHVCVVPPTRSQAAADNAQALTRVDAACRNSL